VAETGPNDARRVVWAIGEYFPFAFGFFLILTKILLYTQVLVTE
jgi:hypothetical protein